MNVSPDHVGPDFPRLTRPLTSEEMATLGLLVIHQAFKDANCFATRQGVIMPGVLTCAPEEVEEARRWLTRFTDDLEIVCGWAGIEPHRVITNAKRQAREGWVTPPPQRGGKGLGAAAFQAAGSPDEEGDPSP